MNKPITLFLAILSIGLVDSDLIAQGKRRGPGQHGRRNNQAAQKNQQQRSFGQSSTGQNGRRGVGQGQNGRGQPGKGRHEFGGQRENVGGQPNTLTAQERYGLTLMREEEKLARDVYVALGKKWGSAIFTNISRAESNHMQAVARLLSRYQIPDPVVSQAPGSFTQPRFKQLYQSLVNDGSASLTDAFKVGLKIEEMDIADLRMAIEATGKDDIKQVLQHLEQGSRNHLRAFASQLRSAGGTYTSTKLSQTEFDSIANGTPGRNGNRGKQSNQLRAQPRSGQGNGNAPHGRGIGSGNNQGKRQDGKEGGR